MIAPRPDPTGPFLFGDPMRLTLALALLLAVPSFAQTPTMTINASWTNPTTSTDGSALPAAAITRTRLEYGTAGTGASCSFGTRIADQIVAGNAATGQIPGLAVSKYAVRAFTTANGMESGPSNVACTNAPPNPASGLSVNVTVNVTISTPNP